MSVSRMIYLISVPLLLMAALLGFTPSQSANAAVWSSCERFGQHQFGNYIVRNNMWNADTGQCISANSKADWDVTATFTGTAVKTYPSVQRVLYRTAGSFASMKSHYAVRVPSSGITADAAYDIWLNNWNTELMIWVVNRNQTPFGEKVGSTTIYGQHWDIWQSGNDAFAFVLDHNQSSGTVHIKSVLRWMVNHGKISNSTEIQAVEWGIEICSTSGVAKQFHNDEYTLNWTNA
jgi:hypothetical protein